MLPREATIRQGRPEGYCFRNRVDDPWSLSRWKRVAAVSVFPTSRQTGTTPIRHHDFGEGGYAESEMVVQRLLREAGREGVPDAAASVVADGFEAQAIVDRTFEIGFLDSGVEAYVFTFG